MHIRFFLLLTTLVMFCTILMAQIPTQTVRGKVVDQDSKIPLIGATIELIQASEAIATVTDYDGNFKLERVPVGRQMLEVNYLGYEPAFLRNLSVESGKELVLNIELQESLVVLEEVVITAKADKKKTLNEMVTVSGRSFSVEETEKYAASFLDPSRMAQNYAGVVSAGDDLSNEIVIRGNSPTYVQWRLEGIQIPAPNHFANKGSSGGGVSMLSSSMLADSDFYTGAFPAEIGNTLAGAFDLNFRKGNNEKRESSFMAGVIGIEASTEGPFSKNSKASYLVNYRYSALELIGKIADLDFGDFAPNFQDFSFKVNLPTEKAGVFSFFGLLATASAVGKIEQDSLQWTSTDDLFSFNENNKYGLLGFTHRYLFKNQKTYLKTVLAGSLEQYEYKDQFLHRDSGDIIDDEIENLKDEAARVNVMLNHKASAKHSFRVGTTLSQLGYEFRYTARDLNYLGDFRFSYSSPYTLIDTKGSTYLLQGYAQHKFRPHKAWTINTGLHYMYLGLTGGTAVEPRTGVKWTINNKHSIALSAGLHSQAEHLINYTLSRTEANGNLYQPNIGLGLTKAAHYVFGYDWNISPQVRLKAEVYYQRLFDVPVDTTFVGGSILNANDVYDILFNSEKLINTGSGQNKGIDLTLERFFDEGFYYLITGSVFQSTFVGQDGRTYNTRFNSGYNLTTLAGKEYKVGKAGQNKIGLNGKIIYNGGNRYTEYDFSTRRPTIDGIYKLQAEAYYRIDFGLTYIKNREKSTHKFTLEFQNLTNRENVFSVRPNFNNGEYRTSSQGGIIPNFNYRIEF